MLGMLIDAALVGIFFAKIARPGRRAVTVMWSKNAVVTLRDGVMCLVWQMTDIQVSQLVETHFRKSSHEYLIRTNLKMISHLKFVK